MGLILLRTTDDPETGSGYLYVRDRGRGLPTTSVHLGDGIWVDLDVDDRIIGIEKHKGPLQTEDLVRVLQSCRIEVKVGA